MSTILEIIVYLGIPFLIWLAWKSMKFWYRDTIFISDGRSEVIYAKAKTFMYFFLGYELVYLYFLETIKNFLMTHYIIGTIIFIVIGFIIFAIFSAKPETDDNTTNSENNSDSNTNN